MENQTNIVFEYLEMIAREEKRLKENNNYKRLTAASDLYDELLEQGIIEKRGYTLRTIDDWHLWRGRLPQ